MRMTKDEQSIANLKKLKSFHNGSYGADIDIAIKALKQQPCEDSVSRKVVDNLVDELARAISDERLRIPRGRSTGEIMQDILDLPSVTPTRKTGHWKLVQVGKRVDLCCANCGVVRVEEIAYNYTIDQLNKFFKEDYKEFLKMPDMRYCPCCGAEMENEE